MPIVTRELSVGEIISGGFSLFIGHFLRIVIPLIFGAVATALVRLWFTIQLAPLNEKLLNFTSLPVNATNAAEVFSLALQSAAYAVLEALILFVVTVTFFAIALKVAFNLSNGQPANFEESFAIGLQRSPRLILSGFIVAVIVLIGLALVVVPGIIFIIMFLMFIPAIVIENESGLGSLGRSRQLASRRWGVILLVALAAFILSAILGIIFGSIFYFLNPYYSAVVQPFYGLVADVLGISLLTVLYQSLKARENPVEMPPPPSAPSI